VKLQLSGWRRRVDVFVQAAKTDIVGFEILNLLHKILQRSSQSIQSPDDQLFSPTVFDDVAFGPIYQGFPPDQVQELVDEALATVGMSAYAGRVSHHLSMGEKKRIAIASVLSMKPEVLVLDEPTSGLDPRARRSLIELLDELNLTMLVSTHDMLMVNELLPRMIILDEGRIVADGPTQTLMSDETLLNSHGLEMPYPPRDNIRSV